MQSNKNAAKFIKNSGEVLGCLYAISGIHRDLYCFACETHADTRFVQMHASHVSEYLYYICLQDTPWRGGEWLPVELAEESPPTFWMCERGNSHGESHGSGTETIRPCKYENEVKNLSLIHISEPTRLRRISYAVFCLKKKKKRKKY